VCARAPSKHIKQHVHMSQVVIFTIISFIALILQGKNFIFSKISHKKPQSKIDSTEQQYLMIPVPLLGSSDMLPTNMQSLMPWPRPPYFLSALLFFFYLRRSLVSRAENTFILSSNRK
jgi:hypothetical protein